MLLVVSHPSCRLHDAGPGHPESPERLLAVQAALEASDLAPALDHRPARPASVGELGRVHDAAYVEAVRRLSRAGGGWLDPETVVCRDTWEAARHAAGAALTAVETLPTSDADSAFVAVRPPGHHAGPGTGGGFCVFNNVAVAAAALADRGERVLVVDWDAHHGNGTQAVFWDDPRVLFVSLHQGSGHYPESGRSDETGGPDAPGTTLNVPFPAGTTGDHYRRVIGDVLVPVAARFDPGWVLISAGFDAHRSDPLTDLGLSAGDFALMAREVRALAPAPGRTVLVLEGGYEPRSLQASVRATLATLAELPIEIEPPTAGGPGESAVEEARRSWLL